MTTETEERWIEKFLGLTQAVKEWSKDRSTKHGCIIVGPANEIRSIGYNGFPRGINDDIEDRHLRPAKYFWTEHSERNAIYNAARNGTSLDGCTLYGSGFPCVDCARAIIQVGITKVHCKDGTMGKGEQWDEMRKYVLTMFKEAGVIVNYD